MLRGRLLAGTLVTSVPSSTIRPASGVSRPAIIRSVVVLPQPLGPSSEKNSPSPISSDRSSTAAALPNRLLTSTSAIAATGESMLLRLLKAVPVGRRLAVPLVARRVQARDRRRVAAPRRADPRSDDAAGRGRHRPARVRRPAPEDAQADRRV